MKKVFFLTNHRWEIIETIKMPMGISQAGGTGDIPIRKAVSCQSRSLP
jgi:hypothetical protein